MGHGKKKIHAGLELYIDNIKLPEFFFSPKCDWLKNHGDGKSTTNGNFLAWTMASTTDPTEYRVRVTLGFGKKQVVLGPIHLEAQPGNTRPSDEDIVNALREAIGLDPK
ncbi:hypothetical protein OPT61_g10301 [Boeremia exigua]|uniref:Uncharacterized protein n=1 Tax=Boeremia exigua TaxID=749465 RepID=A0ACC2HQM5_9PLEO|nr:hypothetical protein OPT61_g10301 [Boeremia exigua]